MSKHKTKEEHRHHHRYPMHWDVAIVFDETDGRPTLHGRTLEVSVEGISMLLDTNIFSTEPVTVLLAIPPLHHGLRKTIIEARSRMRYTVLSSTHDTFRIGIHLQTFKGNGKALLLASLEERAMVHAIKEG